MGDFDDFFLIVVGEGGEFGEFSGGGGFIEVVGLD